MNRDHLAEQVAESFKPALARTKTSGQGETSVQWRSEPDSTRYRRLLVKLLGSPTRAPATKLRDHVLSAVPLAALLTGIPAIAAGLEELTRWS